MKQSVCFTLVFSVMVSAVIGSRSFRDYDLLCSSLRQFGVSSVVSGGAAGADSLAAQFALASGLPLQVFRPEFARFGRRAPLVRNLSIIRAAQQVVAFWDGASSGTAHALAVARRLGVPCRVVRF